jgi:hypothetical protein
MCFCHDCDLVDARDGRLIGRHIHLKGVVFSNINAPKEPTNPRGKASNRLIKESIFSKPYRDKWGSIFRILAPFLANNTNFEN